MIYLSPHVGCVLVRKGDILEMPKNNTPVKERRVASVDFWTERENFEGGIMKKLIEKKLKEIKDERRRLPEFSMFGDNNWASLDKTIEILEELLKKPTTANLTCLIAEMGEEIERIESEHDDDEYDEMMKEREPFQDTLEILNEIKNNA